MPEPYWFDRQPGRRLQIGGAIALGIGILLLIFVPHSAGGSPVDVHNSGWAFVVVGIFGLLCGILGRKMLL